MTSFYHPNVYDPAHVAPSWWEASLTESSPDWPALKGQQRCEVAVIGAGYTGLSAGLHLARDHGRDVRVLDAAFPGWGASGRNGGFCCLGGARLSLEQLIRHGGIDGAQRYLAAEREAVAMVRDLAAREQLQIDAVGSGEVLLAHRSSRVAGLRREQQLLKKRFNFESSVLHPDDLAEQGLGGTVHAGALHFPEGFGLHPLKYARGLADRARRYGARIHAYSPVLAWERQGGVYCLETPEGVVRADQLLLATNAYTPERPFGDQEKALLPVQSSIIVTRPLSQGEMLAQGWSSHTMAYDTRTLLSYFRLLPDRRFLFGGRGDLSGAPLAGTRVQSRLSERFRALFPTWSEVEIDYSWSGLICMSADGLPHLGSFSDQAEAYYALAYHGNGVAMGSWMGRAAANIMAGTESFESVPELMRKPLRSFRFPALRKSYLRAAVLGYQLRDALP